MLRNSLGSTMDSDCEIDFSKSPSELKKWVCPLPRMNREGLQVILDGTSTFLLDIDYD